MMRAIGCWARSFGPIFPHEDNDMKKISIPALLCFAALLARADTSVVFNEIMYHPATNEPAMEWLELYNQMAVDVDMSGWSLDGDIHYRFGSDVVVHGGAFVVLAISPTNLAAITGLTNILGPYTNRLSNSGGKLLLRNNSGRVVNEVDYGVSGDWPVAPDGSGVSLAKLDHSAGSASPQSWTFSAQMGGTPGRENFPTNSTPLPLAFNEISSSQQTNFWVELFNYGTNTLSIGSFVIVRDGPTNGQYILPPAITLAARSFLTLSNLTLGFHAVDGDKLYLLPAARTNVIDAVLVRPGSRARSPDGTGPWLTPTPVTPGASNSVTLHREVVINEIMYHHQSAPGANGLPPQSSDEQWVELYNKSTNMVDLTGWHLEGGIDYDFLPGKTLSPGSYLVVARNATALRALYPSIDIVGDFSGKLSHKGDSIVLDDGADNPVSSVRYYTGGRWAELADGGGSSLELRDPNADTSRPEAWAASDESSKSSWQNFSYQGIAQTIVGTDQWNDFILGMLNDGECLVDDLSVLESPGGSPVQFLANGNFESGVTGWRFLGNHMLSRVEVDPGSSTNHVLHVIAGGVQGDQQDHIERTYASNKKVTNGRTYQISFRAKWLSGNNLLNTRLYYDRVAKTSVLPVPILNGTPGGRNSRYATNIGPTFAQFQHRPVVPGTNQSVTVSVVAQDPQTVTNCEVWWSANGAAFSHAAMGQTNGIYSGTIPGFAGAAIVQFYVRALDGLGAASTWPAAASNAGALYMVNDGQADLSQGHNFRVVLSRSDWALLRASTNLLGGRFLPCTLIYDEQRPYYDLVARLKGSALGRVGDPHPSFHLQFQADDLFRGVHSDILLDTSGRPGYANQQEEIVVHHMANHAGGIPDIHQDMCRVIPPYVTNSTSGVIEPRFEDEFIATAFPNGDNGTEFDMELDYYPTTANGAGYKLPSPQSLWGTDITDLGDDKETYRYNFLIKNHRGEDDYSRFIPFAKTLTMPNGPILDAQSKQVMDVDEWLRVYALISLVGEGDYYTFGRPHNLYMYIRPGDNRVLAFPWDVEQVFFRDAGASLIGNPSTWTDIESVYPENRRRLYAHALDIIATTFNTNYMAYWVAHYSSFAPGQNFSDLLSYIPVRTAAVQSEINAAGGDATFTVGGANIFTSNNLVTLTGTAPIQVQSFLINGIACAVTWTTVSNWVINVPVSAATNVLNLTARDLNGNPLTNYDRTITVNYTGAAPNPAGTVAINEIAYNPLLADASYVELFNSSTNVSFDLSNWRMNGLDYTFPPGSIITNGQYLVLAKDQSAFLNAYGVFIPPFDEFSGNLQTNGETLTLFMPATQTNQPDFVVDKVKYSPLAPWPPAAAGISLQLKDPRQDHFRVANWGAAPGTPGSTNSLNATIAAFAPLWLNELQADNLTGITNSAGQRTAWLELFNPTTNVVSLTNLFLTKTYTNLTAWAFPTGTVVSPGQFKVIFADGLTNLSTVNEFHTSFSLQSGAGSLALSRLSGGQTQVLDYVDYTNLIPNRSYGSFPDGQSFDRQQFFYATPATTNNNASAALSVVINEWMAGNTHTLTNPLSGKYSDWFELYNYGTNTANLAGYYLTDSLTNQFNFLIPPGYSIPPHGFLLVWADAKNTNGTADLHVTFKLDKSGESLGLYGSDGAAIDYINYGAQTDDVSEGRFPDGAVTRFFMPTATPRTNNVIPNTAPLIAAISNKFIHVGQTLSFLATATDAQSPPQVLTFTLDSGAPAGATINPSTGAFTWATTDVPFPSTNSISVRVTDNGTPPLDNAAAFLVSILPPPQFGAARPLGDLLPLSFSTLPGQTYQIQFKDNLDDPSWNALTAAFAGTGGVIEYDDNMAVHEQRFYRLAVLP
jgi:hypothetical protein